MNKIRSLLTVIFILITPTLFAQTIVVIGCDEDKNLYVQVVWDQTENKKTLGNQDINTNNKNIVSENYITADNAPSTKIPEMPVQVKDTKTVGDVLLINVIGTKAYFDRSFTRSNRDDSSQKITTYFACWYKIENTKELIYPIFLGPKTKEFLEKQTYTSLMKNFEEKKEEKETNFLNCISNGDEDYNFGYATPTDNTEKKSTFKKTFAFVNYLLPSQKFLKNVGYGIFAGTTSGILSSALEAIATKKDIHPKIARYTSVGIGTTNNLLLTKNGKWSTRIISVATQAATHYLFNRYQLCSKIIY